MRKYLVAGAIGLMLIAGQAAASDSAIVNLGDRIGSQQGPAANDLTREQWALLILLLGGGIGLAAWGFSEKGSGVPASP